MIIGGGRRPDFSIKKEEKGLGSLTMYNEKPDSVIPFDDFATLALERFAGDNHKNIIKIKNIKNTL